MKASSLLNIINKYLLPLILYKGNTTKVMTNNYTLIPIPIKENIFIHKLFDIFIISGQHHPLTNVAESLVTLAREELKSVYNFICYSSVNFFFISFIL